MPPKGPVSIARNPNTTPSGVLPVDPASLQAQSTKATSRLKLEVRRLPPGLTLEEFRDAFGEEWRVGAGKVDWLEYRPGKVKSPSKQPEQSRAYVHLTNESHIKPFEAKFLSITFQDGKGTHKDPNLRHLPPTLGFAASQRVPSAKQRVDGRQGTIDQDPEFIAFLESETQPVTKPTSLDSASAEKPAKEKVTTTPLIEALREKKASKAKAAAAKSAKRNEEIKEDKTASKGTAAKGAKANNAEGTTKGSKADQAAKDVVKVANKQAAKATAASVPPAAEPSATNASPATARKRERVTPNAIKSMLQRDLGLTSTPRRGAKQSGTTESTSSAIAPGLAPTETASAREGKSPKASRAAPLANKENGQTPQHDSTKTTATPPTPNVLKKAQTAAAPPKAPKGKANATATGQTNSNTTQASTNPSAAVPKVKAPPQPSPGATKAYLKHANASQGITEPLIQAALATFGEVVSVEIDKRKGTALAEFKHHDSLKAAMAKRSVSVGQGAVEILEFREKPAPQNARGGGAAGRGGSMRGRGRGGRGGSPAASSVGAAAASTTTAPVTPAPVASGDAT